MTRWKIVFEYDGTPFVGWQRQDNGLSVQTALEAALAKFAGYAVAATAAGRTDAGVHARGQVAHFDLDVARDARAVRDGLNHHLMPHPIAVISAEPVGPGFHARISAIERRYRYRIINRRAPLALERNRGWQLSAKLDAEAMQAAAQLLVGHHDFTTFRAAACQAKTPFKTIDEFRVSRHGEEIEFLVRARSFLHHQVRNMVGSLVLVGRDKWSLADLKSALEAKDRQHGGPTAPPEGLYFLDVRYLP